MAMTIPEIIKAKDGRGFSFEVLPPLKGKGIGSLFASIDVLRGYEPSYINITTHRSEYVYKETADGLFRRVSERVRPGTVAVAAAIQHRYGITAVPHLICSGFTKRETEYALIDLNFLGINNLLLLRGDKARHESRFSAMEGGHSYACELGRQVNEFNAGVFSDGTPMDVTEGMEPFSYGVAGYPEKHDEAPNAHIDLSRLKEKVDGGADYVVTQMFFDNRHYFDFVRRCREAGINVPIIPGLKPIVSKKQLSVLPKVFHVDLPTVLADEIAKCKDDAAVKEVGAEWCAGQMDELYRSGVPSVHLYSLNAVQSVSKILKKVL